MKDILNNKFTDQASLTNDFLVPEVSNYLQINETEIEASAKKIIKSARSYNSYNAFEKLMHEYDLSSSEGIVLMCLAEALLRIPDNKTINDLIEDKIPTGQWKEHIKNDNNIFVNISSIAFLMTGKILKQGELKEADIFMSAVKNISKPVLRSVIKQSINILAKQFIFEKDIKRASKLSKKLEDSIYAYSFDMLGEGARTYADDDLIGFDRSLNLGYSYDSDSEESGWIAPAGYLGSVFVETPVDSIGDPSKGIPPAGNELNDWQIGLTGFQTWIRSDLGQRKRNIFFLAWPLLLKI